ncbi:hypothetical protein GCM10027072_10680 [Streptomyces bullii]
MAPSTSEFAARTSEDDDCGDGGELVAYDDGVGGLQGKVGAGLAHGDAGVRGGQRRGVVNAVADHQPPAALVLYCNSRTVTTLSCGSSPARTSMMPTWAARWRAARSLYADNFRSAPVRSAPDLRRA